MNLARVQGYEVVVAAIKEETSPEIESRGATVHWLSLGDLSKLIETFRREGVTRGHAGPPFASPKFRLPHPLRNGTVTKLTVFVTGCSCAKCEAQYLAVRTSRF